MPAVSNVNQTSDPYINGILGSTRWASGNLTYSFPISASQYELSYGSGEPSSNFGQLSTAQQNAARAAFASYAAVANVTFTEIGTSTANTATMRVALSDKPGTAWGYFPTTATEGGDVWLNKSSGAYANPVQGNYAFTTFIHEIGHALGLKHPHEGTAMPSDRDFMEYTVMSYRSHAGQSSSQGYVNETWGYAQSPMMYDIAALQSMYGANFATNSGNTTYTWSPTTGQMFVNGIGQGTPGGNKILLTLWDGGGNDTYDFSNYTTNLSIDLRPGMWSTVSAAQVAKLSYDGVHMADGNIANALQFNGDVRSLIENVVGGAGNDRIAGNEIANVLSGRDGADSLFGLGGDDRLQGDAGNDRIWGGSGHDESVFYGRVGDYTISRTASMVTITARATNEGTDQFNGVETFHFADGDLFDFASIADFNGDGRADIPLQSGRALGIHFGQLGGISVLAPTLSDGWNAVIAGDFNGDGRADMLLQNEGRLAIWNMQGATMVGGGEISGLGAGWMIADTGDFNFDGKADLLLQNGQALAIWMMNGTGPQLPGGGNVGTLGAGWTTAGTGDFNRDGFDDILLQNGQQLAVWLMRGVGIMGGSGLTTALGQGWMVAGTGDFGGSSATDILLKNGNTLAIWDMEGTSVTGGGVFGVLSQGWDVAGVGNFSAGGRADILLHNGDQLAVWEIDNNQLVGGGNLGSGLQAGWEVW